MRYTFKSDESTKYFVVILNSVNSVYYADDYENKVRTRWVDLKILLYYYYNQQF